MTACPPVINLSPTVTITRTGTATAISAARIGPAAAITIAATGIGPATTVAATGFTPAATRIGAVSRRRWRWRIGCCTGSARGAVGIAGRALRIERTGVHAAPFAHIDRC